MAIVGEETTAYRVFIRAATGELGMGEARMVSKDICLSPEDAILELKEGYSAIIAGYDMDKLREMLAVKA